ncbi:DUF5996 family protein [Bradyrhizobium sp.]|uniref:DUF5996 family protein n=1 Tax=Bradyrhizobium sp. TaxID=376 RepID=UPI003C52EB1D
MSRTSNDPWPDLAAIDLRPTTDALHLWSQVAGKVRLMLTPWINHSWQATFYLSGRGFTTGPIYADGRAFEMEFDLLSDLLRIDTAEGEARRVKLEVQSVAAFYQATMAALAELGLAVDIHRMPCEIPDAVAFNEDHAPRAYDPDAARAYWRAMLQVQRVFLLFRSRFVGKCSPIHLFWGSFDLAVTRFSGRDAPPHPGGMPHVPDAVAREAYCREVSSAGFWPGIDHPTFYSYAYPVPDGFGLAKVEPEAAKFDTQLGEFLLPYDAVRSSADPDTALLAFLQSTYEAAADLAHWERSHLERAQGKLGRLPEDA